MESVSLAISIVSLLDTCLTAARLYSLGKNHSPDSESLGIELLWQQSRLKSWAKMWQIPLQGVSNPLAPSPAVTLLEQEVKEAHLNLRVVERTLQSMNNLLLQGEKLSSRYPDDIEKGDRLVTDKAKETWKRCRWLLTDMVRLTQVISSLRLHNDELWRIRPRGDTSSEASNQTATACEAMATLTALKLSFPQSPNGIAQPELNQMLSMIMHGKEVETTPVQNLDEDLGITEWKNKLPQLNFDLKERQIGLYIKGHGKFRTDHDVLVEWKPYFPTATNEAKSIALERTDRIARLLSQSVQLEGLRVLSCKGYFHDIDKKRCGILFQLPSEFSGKSIDIGVINLLKAYRTQRPALAERFHLAWMLARSMLKFHLFRWLHKDFRSENIVFFHSKDQVADLRSPYVTAFGLARPDQLLLASESNHETDETFLNRALAYCHPDYQHSTETMLSNAKKRTSCPRYHRAFDVYSLGCVLLEIGLWQSLESTMNWPKYQNDRHEWQHHMIRCAEKQLGFQCGTAYRDIVVRCLSIKAEDQDSESEMVRDFCWTIVRVLENLRV